MVCFVRRLQLQKLPGKFLWPTNRIVAVITRMERVRSRVEVNSTLSADAAGSRVIVKNSRWFRVGLQSSIGDGGVDIKDH